MSGNVADKATAFRNEVTGSTTRKIVCKASNHDLAGPKKKHVDCKPARGGVLLCMFLSSPSRPLRLLHAILSIADAALASTQREGEIERLLA